MIFEIHVLWAWSETIGYAIELAAVMECWSIGVLVSLLGQKTSNFRNCHVIQENTQKSNLAPFALFHHSSTPLLQKVIKNGNLSPSGD